MSADATTMPVGHDSSTICGDWTVLLAKDPALCDHICSLSGACPMRDPVQAADGFLYERSAIEAWL